MKLFTMEFKSIQFSWLSVYQICEIFQNIFPNCIIQSNGSDTQANGNRDIPKTIGGPVNKRKRQANLFDALTIKSATKSRVPTIVLQRRSKKDLGEKALHYPCTNRAKCSMHKQAYFILLQTLSLP